MKQLSGSQEIEGHTKVTICKNGEKNPTKQLPWRKAAGMKTVLYIWNIRKIPSKCPYKDSEQIIVYR